MKVTGLPSLAHESFLRNKREHSKKAYISYGFE